MIKRTVLSLIFFALSVPLFAQPEFLMPPLGKSQLYRVDYISPMGDGEFYLTLESQKRGERFSCNIKSFEDSLMTMEISSSSVSCRDSSGYYILKAGDLMMLLFPSISGLSRRGGEKELVFPKTTRPGERYRGTAVTLQGELDKMDVILEVKLGEIVVNPPESLTLGCGRFNAMKVTNSSEITLLGSPQRLYFTIWYTKEQGPLRFSVSTMEGLMQIECTLVNLLSTPDSLH